MMKREMDKKRRQGLYDCHYLNFPFKDNDAVMSYNIKLLQSKFGDRCYGVKANWNEIFLFWHLYSNTLEAALQPADVRC